MPSGAKKRKAAKKKKGRANNPNTNNNAPSITHSNDDNNYVSHEHEKDSDGCEAEVETNSPTSEDHHDDAFNEASAEVDRSEPLSVVSLNTETKSMEGFSEVCMEENGANKAFEIVEEGKSIETECKSTNEVPSDLQEAQEVEPVFTQKDKVEPEDNGAIEILEGNHQNKLVDIACIETTKESQDSENEQSGGVTADYKLEVVEKKLEETGDVFNRTTQSNNLKEHVELLPQEPIAVADSAPASESSAVNSHESEALVSEKVIHMVESSPAEDTIASKLDLKENGKELPSTHEVLQISTSKLDSPSKKIKEEVVHIMDEIDGHDRDEVAAGKEDKLQPYEGSKIQTSEKTKDVGAVESSEQQPPVSLAPRVAQRTSWMSCCGLFDAIMGSR